MKKKVQLSTVIKIKEHLEKLILSSQEYISKYNDTEMKVEKSLETIKQAEEALIPIKEVIQDANKTKHTDGKTNNYYIYRLSNLKGRKMFLLSIKTSDKSQLSKEQIDKEIAEIDKEVNEIKVKLTEFNSKEISIELTDSLSHLGLDF